jgi:hypothetical protein
MSRSRTLLLAVACALLFGGCVIRQERAGSQPAVAADTVADANAHQAGGARQVPAVKAPIMFDTPEADAICSAMQILPPDNPWNQSVEDWPLHPNSKGIVKAMGADKPLRYDPDINFIIVPPDQKKVDVRINGYPTESDKGPFPIPGNIPIEGWPLQFRNDPKLKGLTLEDVQRDKAKIEGDRHAIVIDPASGLLYEFFAFYKENNGWKAAQSSIFNLKSNKLRPDGWTSADAAGLPIFPATVRYDELKRGKIEHAMRVTAHRTRRAYVYPATHFASEFNDENYPRMGERFRLRKDFDVSGFSPEAQTILKGLQKYGMLMADNGNAWAISAMADSRIPNLHEELRKVKGSDFEVIVAPTPGKAVPKVANEKASVWMRTKSAHAENILAGLTEGDFSKVKDSAETLNVASYLEALYRTDVPGYKQQVDQFVAANETLIRMSKDKNLLGATMAYNQLTLSCVQCHQIVRDGKK